MGHPSSYPASAERLVEKAIERIDKRRSINLLPLLLLLRSEGRHHLLVQLLLQLRELLLGHLRIGVIPGSAQPLQLLPPFGRQTAEVTLLLRREVQLLADRRVVKRRRSLELQTQLIESRAKLAGR